jgi:hypothetical protein
MHWIPSWNRQGEDRPRSAGNFVGDGINAAKRIMGVLSKFPNAAE